jgi:ABC-type transport system substrate-binding protein
MFLKSCTWSRQRGEPTVAAGVAGTLRAAAGVAWFAVAATCMAAADPNKVLRIAFPTGETGFDPVKVFDLYSATVNEAIFDRLLTYEYLASPAKLAPMAAEAMPEVADEGRTYTFRIRKGVYFTPDPAFKGVKRELVAQDFVYSIMRFMDPVNRSQYAFLIEGKIKGLDALAAAAKKSGKFDYDAKLPDMEAVDRYTLRFRLASRDYNFPFIVAHTAFGVVAREVIEAYPNDTMAHPVGTGPYQLKEWKRGTKIVLEANPGFASYAWDWKPTPGSQWDEQVVATMKGKTMPQIGRVEISIMEEDQTRWLAFGQKEIDILQVPSPFVYKVINQDNQLLPEWVDQKVNLFRAVNADVYFTYFNFEDPVVGGFGKDRIALRRAIIMALNVEEQIRVVRKNQAIQAQMPVPQGVVGHDPKYRGVNPYDPDLANKLLDHFGFRKAADGYRRLPDGKPLVLRQASGTSSIEREQNELWKKSMDAIGVHIDFQISKFADLLKAARACQLMMWSTGWTADYPDGDNFMQLLYGPNAHQSNNGCYRSPAFDAFYVKSTQIPDSPERNRLFLEMSRQMEVDGAWSVQDTRLRNALLRPWVRGYKAHPVLQAPWQNMDIQP